MTAESPARIEWTGNIQVHHPGILPADNLRLPEPTGMQWDEHDERL